MITILFVSEGATDLGPSFPAGKLDFPEPSGILPPLLKRITMDHRQRDAAYFIPKTITLARLHREQEEQKKDCGVKGYAQKVKYLMQQVADPYSQYADCTAIVLVVDRDQDPGRIKRLREGREEARKSIALQTIPIALGMAIVTIEAWLLADARALGKGLRISPPNEAPQPEKIPDPKSYIHDLFDKRDARTSAEKYQAVIEQVDIDKLKRRCPKGFLPFWEEVQREILPVFVQP